MTLTDAPDTPPRLDHAADPAPPPAPGLTAFGPDFPFAYDTWLNHPDGLGTVPPECHGEEVAIIGAGISGLVAAYELMRMGLRPVVFEASRMGGRLRSEPFSDGDSATIAELGGMRFPRSSAAFFHYVDLLGAADPPLPQSADRRRRIHCDRAGRRGLVRPDPE